MLWSISVKNVEFSYRHDALLKNFAILNDWQEFFTRKILYNYLLADTGFT